MGWFSDGYRNENGATAMTISKYKLRLTINWLTIDPFADHSINSPAKLADAKCFPEGE